MARLMNHSGGMRLPNLLIIGAQKAGSTWLYDRLKSHPDVFLPEAVELLYFNRLGCRASDSIISYSEYFDKSEPRHKWVGEKTPGYFWSSGSGRFPDQPPRSHNPRIPESVMEVLGPEIAILISLRHPVARAISAYGHHAKRRRINTGETLIQVADRFGILDIGFYDKHLAAWEDVFASNFIDTIIFESEIKQNPCIALDRMSRHLGISREGFIGGGGAPINVGIGFNVVDGNIEFGIPGVEPIRPRDVGYLMDEYSDTLSCLRDRFGKRLSVWDELSHSYEKLANGVKV